MTELDQSFAAMQANGAGDAARLRYYNHMADTELCLLLEQEPAGDTLSPVLFDLEEGRFVLVFDGEDRLAGFVGTAAPYAALPGRVIAGMLAGQGIGLGINLGAEASLMIPAQAVDWLAETLGQGPQEMVALPRQVHAPLGLPPALLVALEGKLMQMAGLGQAALLAGVTYADGRRGHLLAFVGARPGAEPALAKAAGEALTFSGVDAGEMDVGFVQPGDPLHAALVRHALQFDLPQSPVPPQPQAPAQPPGSNPAKPPILR